MSSDLFFGRPRLILMLHPVPCSNFLRWYHFCDRVLKDLPQTSHLIFFSDSSCIEFWASWSWDASWKVLVGLVVSSSTKETSEFIPILSKNSRLFKVKIFLTTSIPSNSCPFCTCYSWSLNIWLKVDFILSKLRINWLLICSLKKSFNSPELYIVMQFRHWR